jgi:hypothetical protein
MTIKIQASKHSSNSASSRKRSLKSKYAPIWEQLKATGVCRITAPIEHHKVIIHMLQKRRDRDIAFKYQLAENGMKHQIPYEIQGTIVTFRLKKIVTINGL